MKTVLYDGLDDGPMLDDDGFPEEMDPDERERILDEMGRQSFEAWVADNVAYLKLASHQMRV